MIDKVFGELSFKFGWTKYEMLDFCGNQYNVRIRTSSMKNQLPTEQQQIAYLEFKKNYQSICEKATPMIQVFVKSHKEDIHNQLGVQPVDNLTSLIAPFEVLFFQNGKYALIFTTKWSEADMCILCDGADIKVDESYILEFEY